KVVVVANLSGWIVMFRLDAAGNIDETFGSGGLVAESPTGDQRLKVMSAAIGPDGNILLSTGIGPHSSDGVIGVEEYDANGQFRWRTTTPFGWNYGASQYAEVAVGPNGKVVVSSGYGGQVARYNPDGTLDASFATE